MPVFDGHYIAARLSDTMINGVFVEESQEKRISFSAQFGIKERFKTEGEAEQNISGKWETIFSPGNEDKRHEALGVFEQSYNFV